MYEVALSDELDNHPNLASWEYHYQKILESLEGDR